MKSNRKHAPKASVRHYCGEHGHRIANCTVKFRENSQRHTKHRANIAQSEDDSDDCLSSVGDNTDAAKSSEVWLVDSSATQHMMYSKEYMKNLKELSPFDVHLADGGVVTDVSMKTPHGVKKGVLTKVWYIPKLSRNLFSVESSTKDVEPITFECDGCFADTKGLKWKLGAREGKGLFQPCMTPMMPKEANTASSKDRKE